MLVILRSDLNPEKWASISPVYGICVGIII
jgi:hypothetical protein